MRSLIHFVRFESNVLNAKDRANIGPLPKRCMNVSVELFLRVHGLQFGYPDRTRDSSSESLTLVDYRLDCVGLAQLAGARGHPDGH